MEVNAVQNTSYQQFHAVQNKKGPAESRADNTQVRKQEEMRRDEYVKGELGQETSAGIYHVTQDENGDRRVQYEDPNQPATEKPAPDQPSTDKSAPDQPTSDKSAPDKTDPAGPEKDDPEKRVEECTTNTDRVDREIAKLKEENQRLQQEIRSASGDEEAVRKLERQLANVRNELLQKDNDTYRRQHADIS